MNLIVDIFTTLLLTRFTGLNTVGFTTFNKDGVHKFKLFKEENTLKDIKILEGGSNYQNRQLFVK